MYIYIYIYIYRCIYIYIYIYIYINGMYILKYLYNLNLFKYYKFKVLKSISI